MPTTDETPTPATRWTVPEHPNWDPLKKLVGLDRVGFFMAMGEVRAQGLTIYAFKHTLTRQYVYLDAHGQAYKNSHARYAPIPTSEALLRLLI